MRDVDRASQQCHCNHLLSSFGGSLEGVKRLAFHQHSVGTKKIVQIIAQKLICITAMKRKEEFSPPSLSPTPSTVNPIIYPLPLF